MGSLKAAHGGGLRTGRRKTRRPFVPRRPMHVVLRSSRARGELSLLRPDHERKVAGILRAQAKKHFVQLQEFVNVGNHIHIKVKANTRESFQAFLISVTALIARAVTGARRGHAFSAGSDRPAGRKFWDALAFTRIVATKFEERILDRYFTANIYEKEMGKEVRDIFLGRVKISGQLGIMARCDKPIAATPASRLKKSSAKTAKTSAKS